MRTHALAACNHSHTHALTCAYSCSYSWTGGIYSTAASGGQTRFCGHRSFAHVTQAPRGHPARPARLGWADFGIRASSTPPAPSTSSAGLLSIASFQGCASRTCGEAPTEVRTGLGRHTHAYTRARMRTITHVRRHARMRTHACRQSLTHTCTHARMQFAAILGPAVFTTSLRRAGRHTCFCGRSFAHAGATWTSRTSSAPWAARDMHTSVINAAGTIYVISGWAANDAWASSDGGADRTRRAQTHTLAHTYARDHARTETHVSI
jgi:hypothetical protein